MHDRDTNRDGAIDQRDGRSFFVTDALGLERQRVTPAGSNCWEFKYDLESRTLYVEVVTDSNNDGQFTTDDRRAIWTYTAGRGEDGKPLVDSGLAEQAQKATR